MNKKMISLVCLYLIAFNVMTLLYY